MKYFITLSLIIFVFIFSNCKKDKNADADLFKEVDESGYVFYKADPIVKESSPQSAHNNYFRVKYNAIAYAALTDTGKLPIGGSFPEGSLVVKELYDNLTGDIQLLAVMKKTNSDNAAQGWEWAEYKTNGDVIYGITKKGEACTSCHSTDARDYNRIFNIFP